MQKDPWPIIFHYWDKHKCYELFYKWLDGIDSGAVAIPDISKKHYLHIETVIHTVASAYLYEGEVEKAIDILQERLVEYPDMVLHKLLLRCLVLAHGTSGQEYFAEAVKWAKSYVREPGVYKNKTANLAGDKKLTLGFVYSHTRSPIGLFGIKPVLEAIDRSKFKVVLINLGNPAAEYYRNSVDRHIDLMSQDPAYIEAAIRDQQIDILIDINGFLSTESSAQAVMEHAAPIQVNWWGNPVTSGTGAIDYIFACKDFIPEEYKKFYTEKIYNFNGCNITFNLPSDIPVAPQPVGNAGMFTFASFASLHKTNAKVLDAWAQILKLSPNTRMFIKTQGIAMPRVQKRIFAAMQKHNVNITRVVFDSGNDYADIIAKHAYADLCLGTFAHAGAVSTLNGLWQGVPSLTIEGATGQSRLASTIMRSAGLEDFIARDIDEYIEKAVYFSMNPNKLAGIRSGMRKRLQDLPLFNPAKFTKEFEQAITFIWQDWLAKSANNGNTANTKQQIFAGT